MSIPFTQTQTQMQRQTEADPLIMDPHYSAPKPAMWPAHGGGIRKRAPKACLYCRSRKVRCDVIHREGRCTNCALDDRDCIIKPRPTRYRSLMMKNATENSINAQPPAPQTLRRGSSNDQREERRSDQQDDQQLEHREDQRDMQQEKSHDGSANETATPSTTLSAEGHPHGSSDSSVDNSNLKLGHQETYSGGAHASSPKPIPNPNPKLPTERGNYLASFDSHVIYSSLPFLDVDLSLMSEHDLHFLDTQGCFKVPDRTSIDEFVREYFLHVHPSLPLLDEAGFWAMYSRQGSRQNQTTHMSLFLFQAMLFAACGFLPLETITRVGFSSIRQARATYYKRAKLLFDFGAEVDPIANAQGALLLSYNAAMRNNTRANSIWLSNAIQLAQSSGAHCAYMNKSQDPKRTSILKRVWWCCVVRDRILPLGLRRPVNVFMESFDAKKMALTEDDFGDEVNNSRVYNSTTKTHLIQLFLTLCSLAVTLTEVIKTIYPSSAPIDLSNFNSRELQRHFRCIQSCQVELQNWYDKATIKFPTPAGIMCNDEPIILYTNLMYIYYHSAKLAMHQHEALILATRRQDIADGDYDLVQSRDRMEDASSSITGYLKELIQLKLVRFLPVSIVAYAAVPFILHLIDVNLSTTPSQVAQRQGQLNIYIEAMKRFQAQYDGTDEVWNFVDTVVKIASNASKPPTEYHTMAQGYLTDVHQQLESRGKISQPRKHSTNNPTDWGHLLLHSPIIYFRLTHTIDLSLCTGRFPEDSEFPRSFKSISFYPFISMDHRTIQNNSAIVHASACNEVDVMFDHNANNHEEADTTELMRDDHNPAHQFEPDVEFVDGFFQTERGPENPGCIDSATLAMLPHHIEFDYVDWEGSILAEGLSHI